MRTVYVYVMNSVNIAGNIITHARNIILKLVATYRDLKLFLKVREKILNLRWVLSTG